VDSDTGSRRSDVGRGVDRKCALLGPCGLWAKGWGAGEAVSRSSRSYKALLDIKLELFHI
jgi:hypothetical protein